MPRFKVKEREFLASIHYRQYNTPQKLGCHKLTIRANSPTHVLEQVEWHWREDNITDRLYPQDIKIVVVADIETQIFWTFLRPEVGRPPTYYPVDKDTPNRNHKWRRVGGPTYLGWKNRHGIK